MTKNNHPLHSHFLDYYPDSASYQTHMTFDALCDEDPDAAHLYLDRMTEEHGPHVADAIMFDAMGYLNKSDVLFSDPSAVTHCLNAMAEYGLVQKKFAYTYAMSYVTDALQYLCTRHSTSAYVSPIDTLRALDRFANKKPQAGYNSDLDGFILAIAAGDFDTADFYHKRSVKLSTASAMLKFNSVSSPACDDLTQQYKSNLGDYLQIHSNVSSIGAAVQPVVVQVKTAKTRQNKL